MYLKELRGNLSKTKKCTRKKGKSRLCMFLKRTQFTHAILLKSHCLALEHHNAHSYLLTGSDHTAVTLSMPNYLIILT